MKMWKIQFLLSTVILIQFTAFYIVQGYPDKNILPLLTTRKASGINEQENLNENLLSGKNVKLIQFTNILRNSINFDVKPCDDFYTYACKKYEYNNINENHENLNDNKNNKLNNNQLDIKKITEILESFYQTEDDNNLSDIEIKSKEFYLSCRNDRDFQQLRNTDVYKLTGGWPIFEDNWKSNSLEEILSEFSKIQENVFFSQTIRIQNNQRIIKIFPVLYKKFNLNRYNRTIYETISEYGISNQKANRMIINLLEFERRRGAIANIDININNQLPNQELTITELNENFPLFNWNIYFQRIFGKTLKTSDRIIIKNGNILEKILKFLIDTKPRIISNYIWNDYLTGKTQKDCINLLQKYFHPIYETIINRPTYNKFEILKVFTEIGKAYDQLFENNICYNNESQQNAKLYLNKQMHILLNGDPKLNNEYDTLIINHRNFYESLENCAKHLAKNKKYDTILIDFYKLFRQSNGQLLYPDSIMSMIFGTVGINLAYEMIGAGNDLSQYKWCNNININQLNKNFTKCSQHFPNDIQQKLIKNPKYSMIMLRNYYAEKLALLALKSWLNLNEEKNIDRNLEKRLLNQFPNLTNFKIFFINAVRTSWCWTENKEFLNSYFMELFKREFNEIFQCNLNKDNERNPKILRIDEVCEIN